MNITQRLCHAAMGLPVDIYNSSSSTVFSPCRLMMGARDHSLPACHDPQSYVTRAASSSDQSSNSSTSSVDSSPSHSPTSPTPTGAGGWSEGSSLPSDADTKQFQLLTQAKPSALHQRTYQLVVTQHPRTAAEFGQHDMSRIPLSPPLFVRLIVRNSSGAEVSADAELPFLVARITLHAASSLDEQDLYSNSELYGTTISTPDSLRDMDGAPGAFFIFPDVGVRRRGCWRLYVSLLRIAHAGSATVLDNGDASTCLAGVWTDPFNVIPAEGYVAPEMTPITRHFQSQGVRMFASGSVVPR